MKRPMTYVLAGLLLISAVSPLYAIAQDGPPGSQQGGPGGNRGPGDQGGNRGPGDHGGNRGPGGQGGWGPGGQGGNRGPGGQGGDRGPGGPGGWGPGDHGGGRGGDHHWARGERFQDHYQGRIEVVDDYRGHRLRRPPHGYHWVRDDSDNFLLVAIATGVISDMVLNSH